MMDLQVLTAFNARYAQAIDGDTLEQWPAFFTADCHYRVTHADNEREGLQAGLVWADSRDMLHDRVAALRVANVYERQRYRHILGMPLIEDETGEGTRVQTPFLVARIMHTGETDVFATGVYHDRFVHEDGRMLLAERVAVCDSPVIDTLLALPL